MLHIKRKFNRTLFEISCKRSYKKSYFLKIDFRMCRQRNSYLLGKENPYSEFKFQLKLSFLSPSNDLLFSRQLWIKP